ncbi:MAG: hypothetical protein ABR518_05255 [Actinomycetota bacterium]
MLLPWPQLRIEVNGGDDRFCEEGRILLRECQLDLGERSLSIGVPLGPATEAKHPPPSPAAVRGGRGGDVRCADGLDLRLGVGAAGRGNLEGFELRPGGRRTGFRAPQAE